MNDMNMIEVNGLCKEYKDFSLKDVSFSVPKGYIMGFIGQNGAGKTTTIRSILGMANYSAGECKIMGMNVKEHPEVRQDVGVVFDELFLLPHLKPFEIEKQFRGFYDNWNSELFHEYLKRFGLPEKKKLSKFSRGMRMKMMLTLALCHDAKLLILDEPTSGLDPVARDELLDILLDFISDGERSVLFSTHITSDLERIADYLTVISEGTIIFTGTKDDLLEKYVVIKGAASDITDDIRKLCIGYTARKDVFEAMLDTENLAMISKEIEYEKCSFDEILVFISRSKTNA